jgi:hypothetical protein
MSGDSESARRVLRAQRIVSSAWHDLPIAHRLLLENIGAGQRDISDEALGVRAHELLRSAGHVGLSDAEIQASASAAGLWVDTLHLVLINANHPALRDLDDPSYEAMVSRIAWHEWGHALSVTRSSPEDLAAGPRLLELVPSGIRDSIRPYEFRKREYTNELVAEVYALLMSRRRRGQTGNPPWLNDEIYELVKRVTGWSE